LLNNLILTVLRIVDVSFLSCQKKIENVDLEIQRTSHTQHCPNNEQPDESGVGTHHETITHHHGILNLVVAV